MDRGLFKKTAAVMLSITLAFGAVSVLPGDVLRNNATVASAAKSGDGLDSVQANGCTFYYKFTERTGTTTVSIEHAEISNGDGTLDIPSTINVDGKDYNVTDIGDYFLENNKTVKNVIIPDTVTRIGMIVFWGSAVENLDLSDNVEEIGYGFCVSCDGLKHENVKYNGTNIKKIGAMVFSDLEGMYNDRGAIALGNWLIEYKPDASATSTKIADLGNNGVKIDHIADGAFKASDNMTTIDLEGVTHIGKNNLSKWTNLDRIQNTESVAQLGDHKLEGTDWLSELEGTKYLRDRADMDLLMFGSDLIKYKTDSNVIDLTSDVFQDVKNVRTGAFVECKNVDTLICNSDHTLAEGSFYADKGDESSKLHDPMPGVSTCKIKDITLDGKKLVFSKESPIMPEWVSKHYAVLEGSEWVKINAEAKMKTVIEQLGMTYYGPSNDKIGTLSAKEEFYNMLKVSEYLSAYELDGDDEYISCVDAFLNGGKLNAEEYSALMHFALECSGVGYKGLGSANGHVWSITKIGGEWFEGDTGYDVQDGHGYGWFALSSSRMEALDEANGSFAHMYDYTANKWHDLTGSYIGYDRPEANRTLGDMNGDGLRDNKDVDMLWDHLSGKGSADKKLGDINFDDVIDITDGVLLDAFVNNKSIGSQKKPADGIVPGFSVAFVNGTDRDSIKYDITDSDGYIVLPDVMFDAPKGKKFDGWNIGKAGEKVKISDPYTVIQPKWKNDMLLGDVDGNNVIDISDVSKLINHINGVKALTDDEILRADVDKSAAIDISDAAEIINHINGVKAIGSTL